MATVRRRLLNLLTVLSLLACLAITFLWVRRGTGISGLQLVTRRGTCWQVSSGFRWVGVLNISDWREPPGFRPIGYSFAKGPREQSSAVLVYTGVPGAHITQYSALGVTLARGGVCYMIDPDGKVLRGPPYATVRPEHLSSPRKFWNVSVRHEAAVGGLALLPAVWLARLGWRRSRAWRLHRRGACSVCGYDLRATPGRCPECGHTPAGATA